MKCVIGKIDWVYFEFPFLNLKNSICAIFKALQKLWSIIQTFQFSKACAIKILYHSWTPCVIQCKQVVGRSFETKLCTSAPTNWSNDCTSIPNPFKLNGFLSQNCKFRRTKRWWQSCVRFHANCITYSSEKTSQRMKKFFRNRVHMNEKSFCWNLLCHYVKSAFHVSFILFNFNCMCKVVLLVQNEVSATVSAKQRNGTSLVRWVFTLLMRSTWWSWRKK